MIPEQVADWQQALGQLAPALCVQVSGREFAEEDDLQTILWCELWFQNREMGNPLRRA